MPNFVEGVCLNSGHDGLLSVAEDRLVKLIKTEPITNVYHVEHTPFARGKFAAVRKCTHKETGVDYAAKFIRKRRRAMDLRQDILHEVAVLKIAAYSARIVSLHEVYETPTEMALILELAAGGELQRVLDTEEGLQESHAIRVMRQILEGLSFLHDNNIAHLDLKPQNLLLTGSYPDCDIKLCDFGISRVIRSGVEVREILGTPDYVAPEILSYEPINLATDIWSVGILAYVLLSGYSPFGGDTKQETFCNISQCCLNFPDELFEGVSTTAKEFIQATLVKDPSNRLTSRQCLDHPWLSESACLIEKLPLPIQTNTEVPSKSEQPPESNGVANGSAHRVNGVGASYNLSNGSSSKDGIHSPDVSDAKSADGQHGSDAEETEELPVHKRPKNSSEDRRSSYPVASCLSCAQCGAQCCHLHTTPRTPEILRMGRQHHHSSINNSPVEITVDRGIIC